MPHRIKLCRRALTDLAGGVTFKLTGTAGTPEARGGVAGVQTCGSVWACPVCSEKINSGRQADLQAGIDAWHAAGGVVVLGTATVRHHKGHRLADLLDVINPAFNRMTSGAGAAWNGSKTQQGDRWRFGISGYARVVETTHGAAGWHPHAHFLLFLREALTGPQMHDLRRRMFGRWQAAVVAKGFTTQEDAVRLDPETGNVIYDENGSPVLDHPGLDLRPVTRDNGLADYFAKNTYGIKSGGAAYEITGAHAKRLGAGRTPFQILEDFVNTGEVDDLDLWHEWEAASLGRRQLTWSRGMRDLLALQEEATDADLAEDDQLDGSPVVTVTEEEWKGAKLWLVLPRLLTALEAGTLHEHLDFITADRWHAPDAPAPRRRRRPGAGAPVTSSGIASAEWLRRQDEDRAVLSAARAAQVRARSGVLPPRC